jgi:hypothetical protein
LGRDVLVEHLSGVTSLFLFQLISKTSYKRTRATSHGV